MTGIIKASYSLLERLCRSYDCLIPPCRFSLNHLEHQSHSHQIQRLIKGDQQVQMQLCRESLACSLPAFLLGTVSILHMFVIT